MDKNRIRGSEGRTSELEIAKAISIKGLGSKSGRCAVKAVELTTGGTPQGGPLSALLSNVLLDDLDREFEKRGHRFVRYADDCNIHVRSAWAAHRVMKSVTQFMTRNLKLQVNEARSKVDRPQRCKFLGFRLVGAKTLKRELAP